MDSAEGQWKGNLQKLVKWEKDEKGKDRLVSPISELRYLSFRWITTFRVPTSVRHSVGTD